jgi:hypothetical protein
MIKKPKPPQVNVSTWQPNIVKLLDGREVLSNSGEYRAECEAVYLLNLPLAERRAMLFGIEGHRKITGRQKVEAELTRVWGLRRK